MLLLDVGCAESLLSHEFAARGFRTVGIDIRDCPVKNKKNLYLKKDISNTDLPDDVFDIVIMVSTIEHIGLDVYGQLTSEDEGDIKAMKELHRILKPGGFLILTTPYIGKSDFRVSSFERNYNRQRLDALLTGFEIIKEDYFYPEAYTKNVLWRKMSANMIDKQKFKVAGLACIIARKPSSRVTTKIR